MPIAILAFLILIVSVIGCGLLSEGNKKIGVILLTIGLLNIIWLITSAILLNANIKEEFIAESQKVTLNGKLVDVVYDSENIINVTKLVPYNIEKSVKVYKLKETYKCSLGIDFLRDDSVKYIVKEEKVEK